MAGLRTIFELAQKGDSAGALSLLNRALPSNSNDPQLLHLGGVLNCQVGQLARGIDLLRRSAQLKPADPEIHFNLAKALLDTGRVDEAAGISKRFAETDSDHRQLLAAAEKAGGDLASAVSNLEAVVALASSDAGAWVNLAAARIDAGDGRGAIAAADRAIALNPNDAAAYRNRARSLALLEDYSASVDAARRATELAPRDAGAWRDLAGAYTELDHGEAALEALGTAANLDRGNAEILLDVGAALGRLGRFADAERAYRFAIERNPKLAAAYLNLGIYLEHANRLEELDTLVQTAERNDVGGPCLDYLLALSARRAGKIQIALNLAEQAKCDAVDEVLRCQLVGSLADRLGNSEQAFAAFEAMNRAAALNPAGRALDSKDHARFVEQLAAINTRAEFDTWLPIVIEENRPDPVFLVGFPRSGTTLLDTILMGHPQTHVLEELPLGTNLAKAAGELRPVGSLNAADIAILRGQYFEQLDALAPGGAGKLVIDKLPFNLLRAPLLHRLFPRSKFIFALRHPCDCVLSCFMQSFKLNRAMASFLTLEDSAQLYDRAMRLWRQTSGFLPIAVHEVRYEDLVGNFDQEVRSLARFLELDWDDTLLNYRKTAAKRDIIRTPSYSQVTEPIYSRSSGRWLRYRQQMMPVLPILEPWIKEFGYGDSGDGLPGDDRKA